MKGDVREVLQYVPLFAGKTFVIVFDEGLLPESAVAETLLDLIALQRIGVKLVVVVVGVAYPVALVGGADTTELLVR